MPNDGGLPGQVWLEGYGWVQPIRDKSGNILYYSDPVSGQRINHGYDGPGTGNPVPGRYSGGGTFPQPAGHYSGGGTFPDPTSPTRHKTTTADSQTHYANNHTSILTMPGGQYGQSIYNALDLPMPATETFTMQVYEGTQKGNALVEYTIAGGLEWLRDLSVNDKEAYNALVAKLYQAGYLSEGQVRFNVFTSDVAGAFALAAHDTAIVNSKTKGSDGKGKADVGGVTTLFDNLDAIIQGAADSGFGPGGGGSGDQPPTRVDRFSDPTTVKEAARTAARSALGRSLTDDEEKAFLASFYGQEQAYNNEQFDASTDQFNGADTTVHTAPNAGDAADSYVRDQFGTEKAAQDLGSYVGVMLNMMGLNGGGMVGGGIS